ncbi:MAG: sugar phosphate isomerase/epimerase [Oscillospiraceae bacterium]|nr:sugar phosphate isomerase/epimerase [Oscillospiraceae bacterium]
MNRFQIGVLVDSFRLPLREGIVKAREIGAEGIQIYAASGEAAPENLSRERRRELLAFIRSQGLVMSAICGDLGGYGFEREDDNPHKIKRSKAIIDLALDLECAVVTTHIGVVPSNPEHSRRAVMAAACRELGLYAKAAGVSFAVETGPEPAAVLRGFIDSLDCGGGMGVNFDPANLVMVIGEDPAKAVKILAPYIIHTHAKDGRMLKKTDPEVIYGFFAEDGIGDLRLEEYFLETPLGEGDVDFPRYLDALEKAGFNGFLTIERETGANPEDDILAAAGFLRSLTARYSE